MHTFIYSDFVRGKPDGEFLSYSQNFLIFNLQNKILYAKYKKKSSVVGRQVQTRLLEAGLFQV